MILKKCLKRVDHYTNEIEEALCFTKRDNEDRLSWWHIEPANTDYCEVHIEHGKALARDAIRYIRREDETRSTLELIFRAMLKECKHDWRKQEVACGFFAEIGNIISQQKKIELCQ